VKKNIHYHSDCPFFAGCENMLVNFFHNNDLKENFNITFSYRYTEKYEDGFKSRVNEKVESYPLNLIDKWEEVEIAKNNIKSTFLKNFVKKFVKDKYFVLFYNYLVLKNFFKNKKIDILHINNGGYPGAYSCLSAVFAARSAGIKKIVFVVNNIAINSNSKFDWIVKSYIKKYTSKFITGSKYAGNALIKELKLPSEKYLTIHNGINLRLLTESRFDTIKRLNLDGFDFIVGIVAILEERKGHIYLIKAIEKIVLSNDKIVLAVEGNGPLESELKTYVKNNNLEKNIKFIGNEKNVFDFINAADMIALPSIGFEDFPNVILESMALGKVVIASNIAGVPEQIENMESGIIVEAKNIEDLYRNILAVMNDKDLKRTISENAKKRFFEMFTDNKSVDNYIKLYKNLLTG